MENIIKYVIPAVLILLAVGIILSGYVKASPDVAVIISGLIKENI